MSRTDQEIVDQTNELALEILKNVIGIVPAAEVEGFKVYDHIHDMRNTRLRGAWAMACRAQELLTQTDPNDALSALEPEEPADEGQKWYVVELQETVNYSMRVQADDEDQAGDIARDTWAESEKPFEEFNGSSEGVTVTDSRLGDDQ